jgi:ABC-type transporter Mla maintaining outer membrane lipid asymmetry permease subunit MlaE
LKFNNNQKILAGILSLVLFAGMSSTAFTADRGCTSDPK